MRSHDGVVVLKISWFTYSCAGGDITMMNLFKGWLKIYLFYGVVFFLLGLFGCLASDQVRLTAWSTRQMAEISQVWPLLTFPGTRVQTVPAFTSRSGKIILQVYQPNETGLPFESLLKQLQSKLQRHFRQVIIMSVGDIHSLDLESTMQSMPAFFIGFERTPNLQQGSSAMRSTLYFGMPDSASYLVVGKLIQVMNGRLPAFYFNKQVYGHNAINELCWDTSDNTENFDNEVFTTFIKIIDDDIIQVMSKPNLE
jgi:hypothetical protein